MKNEVALNNTVFEQEIQSLQTVAKMAQASGLYPGIGGEAKIFMIIMAAKELGISPMMALNKGINIIQGSVELSARLMSSMIRRAGHSIIAKECNDKICILEGTRCDNGDNFTAQFSVEDATKAGLMGRQNWKNYTEDMLYARAMSRLARRLFPDVIGTAYVEGEIKGEVEEKSYPIEPQETEIEIIEPIDEKNILQEFLAKVVEDGDQNEEQWALGYLEAYATKNNISQVEAVNRYVDIEKFKAHSTKWKEKQIEKEKANAPT